MPEPPASTFEPTPQTSRCWRAGARRSAPSSSRSASGSGSRPRTHSDRDGRPRLTDCADRATLAALSLRGLRDRLDELTGLLLVLPEGDVGLGNDADQPAVLDDGQPPNLVPGHELERLFEVFVGLNTDEVS